MSPPLCKPSRDIRRIKSSSTESMKNSNKELKDTVENSRTSGNDASLASTRSFRGPLRIEAP
jgi:hypothetical protein